MSWCAFDLQDLPESTCGFPDFSIHFGFAQHCGWAKPVCSCVFSRDYNVLI